MPASPAAGSRARPAADAAATHPRTARRAPASRAAAAISAATQQQMARPMQQQQQRQHALKDTAKISGSSRHMVQVQVWYSCCGPTCSRLLPSPAAFHTITACLSTHIPAAAVHSCAQVARASCCHSRESKAGSAGGAASFLPCSRCHHRTTAARCLWMRTCGCRQSSTANWTRP